MAPTGRVSRIWSSIPDLWEAGVPRGWLHPTAPWADLLPGQPPVSPDPIVYLHSVFPAGERAAGGGGRSRAPENTSAPWGTIAPWGQGHRACQEVTVAMAEPAPGRISGYLFSTGSLLRRKVVQLKR